MIMGEAALRPIFHIQKLNQELHRSILLEVKLEKASVSVYLQLLKKKRRLKFGE
jgi:hypothetical protein